PFTDDELERFYRACDEIGEVKWLNQFGMHSWNGQDVKDFIVLSIYTGLRISDVATFDVTERLVGNDIYIRAKKNGKRLYTWVPDWARALRLEGHRKFGSKVFQLGDSERVETVTDLWRRKLERVFDLAQKDVKLEHKPVPHRLRHTFVRVLLAHGVSARDVAE